MYIPFFLIQRHLDAAPYIKRADTVPFCRDTVPFCGDIGLSCGDVGLFCRDTGLFLACRQPTNT